MKTNTSSLTFFFSILTIAGIACSVFVGGPEYPSQSVPISADEVQNMQTQIDQAFIAGAETGIVTLQITESQLTSLIALNLQAQTNPPFTEPQILLRNGQLLLFGKIISGPLTANMVITAKVGIDELTGQPKVEISSADFGPLPAPKGFNSAINILIAEAFTGTLGPVAIGFRLESINIADGVMTMTGRIK
jgi:hypothetical protein